MKRFLVPLVCLSALALLFGSCILDPKKEPPPDNGGGGTFKPLKDKDDVLYNFELAYNNRDINEYTKLTDEDASVYIFVFSPEDFASGKTAQSWERAQDLEITGKIFLRGGKTKNLSMNFDYVEGDLTWEEATPPAGHEEESWYQKTVSYDLSLEMTNGQIYFAVDSQALFIIRYGFNTIAADTVWQVVQYRDLGPKQ
jgi:hypothetical protein